jgi:hypothetical protein
MKTTRRLMILGATGLAGLARTANARREASAPGRSAVEPMTLAALLAAGRGALASSGREG